MQSGSGAGRERAASLALTPVDCLMTETDPFAAQRALVAEAGGWFADRPNHALSYLPGRGQRLIVTFDNLSALREKTNRIPWGQGFLAAQGWDVLGVMTKRNDWYRDPTLWAALEGLRDDGFFARFPAVSMYGASMGAFAAVTFAGLAPGCTVMAFAPQSTLDTKLAPFETRYRYARKITDWSGPYADAADGARAAARIYIGFDPHLAPDARHAARIAGDNTILLPMPHLGHKLPPALLKMGLLKLLSVAALSGELTEDGFRKLYRKRRESPLWQAGLIERAQANGHPQLARRLAQTLMAKSPNWRIRHLLDGMGPTDH